MHRTKLRPRHNGGLGAFATIPKPLLEEDGLIDGDTVDDVDESPAYWKRLGERTYVVRLPGEDGTLDDLPDLKECDHVRALAMDLAFEASNGFASRAD